MRVLNPDFFERPALEVAGELLDKYLFTRVNGRKCGGRVVETEAYMGPEDRASHAACGLTARNSLMYGPAGVSYVYLCYGMHFCFNVVCGEESTPGAVLIRALEPETGVDEMKRRRGGKVLRELASGPAKLTQALGIDMRHNGLKLPAVEIYLAASGIPPRAFLRGPRVGISKSVSLNYRFFIKDCRFVSGHRQRGGALQ